MALRRCFRRRLYLLSCGQLEWHLCVIRHSMDRFCFAQACRANTVSPVRNNVVNTTQRNTEKEFSEEAKSCNGNVPATGQSSCNSCPGTVLKRCGLWTKRGIRRIVLCHDSNGIPSRECPAVLGQHGVWRESSMTRFIQEFLRQSNELLEELHRNPRVTYLDIHLLERKCIFFGSNS